MQANGFLAKAALAHAAQPFATLQAAFSDTRPTYSRDAQDDEPIPHDNGMGENTEGSVICTCMLSTSPHAWAMPWLHARVECRCIPCMHLVCCLPQGIRLRCS